MLAQLNFKNDTQTASNDDVLRQQSKRFFTSIQIRARCSNKSLGPYMYQQIRPCMRSREYGTQRAAAVNVEVLLGGLPQETDVGMVLSLTCVSFGCLLARLFTRLIFFFHAKSTSFIGLSFVSQFIRWHSSLGRSVQAKRERSRTCVCCSVQRHCIIRQRSICISIESTPPVVQSLTDHFFVLRR